MTHSYTTLSVKGTILRWPLVTLSMHRKSADHLKVTWYIVRLKKYGLQNTQGGGGSVSTFSPWSNVRESITHDTMLDRVSAWQVYRGWKPSVVHHVRKNIENTRVSLHSGSHFVFCCKCKAFINTKKKHNYILLTCFLSQCWIVFFVVDFDSFIKKHAWAYVERQLLNLLQCVIYH